MVLPWHHPIASIFLIDFNKNLINLIKSNPGVQEEIVEEIVHNPVMLKKVLLQILPYIDDQVESEYTTTTDAFPREGKYVTNQNVFTPSERNCK